MSNVISLKDYRDKNIFDENTYRLQLQSMHKIDILEEMVRLNDQIEIEGWTKNLCKKGIVLYTELRPICETPELTEMCTRMLKFLEATT